MKEIVVGSDVGRRGTPSPPPPPPQALLERLKDYGQEDAFAFWDELSPEERNLLVKDIEVWLFLSLPVGSLLLFWIFESVCAASTVGS